MANIKHAVLARSAPFSAIVTRVEAIDWARYRRSNAVRWLRSIPMTRASAAAS